MASSSEITIIAESSSTRTQWSLVDRDRVLERATTSGMNPFFQTRREISHSIRLELPETFFKRRWKHIYYYGAGCSSPEKCKIVESSLVAQFKTPVTVMSDLLGAARGLLIHQRGLACILGTGSNSCLYDGHDIVSNVRSLGFILGDEGSGAALGRIFVGDVMKNIAPTELIDGFYAEFSTTPEMVMDEVYNNPLANRNLSRYSFFLASHLQHPYVVELICNEFERFFARNICQYQRHKDLPLCFVGAIATTYSEILLDVATRHGLRVQKIVRNSMPGLITYHA